MKFYPTIAPVILSIMYTATIFGPNNTLSEVIKTIPKDICEIIDGFRGENDGFYKETGHIKPYSHQLDLMTQYAKKPNEDRSLIRRNITPTSFIVSLLFLKISSSILPGKITCLLAPIIGLVANHAIANRLVNSHLSIKNQKKVTVGSDSILITNCPAAILETEYRSKSGMLFKDIKSSENIVKMYRPSQTRAARNILTYELNNSKIFMYLSYGQGDFPTTLQSTEKIELYEPLSNDDYQSKDELSSLQIPASVIAFDVSKDEKIVVTVGKKGIDEWELQRRKDLHKIVKQMDNVDID